MPVLRPCRALLALAALTDRRARAACPRCRVRIGRDGGRTPITRAAYARRVRLLHALPLMNNPMVVPMPPTDAAIDQLVAARVIVLEGARRHVHATPVDLSHARSVQAQEYRSVGGLASLVSAAGS